LRNEPFWLPPEEIIELNRDLVAGTGEPFLLRDRALLESACARPINLWAYEQVDDAVALAVSLLFGIAQNHVFMQGNKRTGFIAALMMLRTNSWRLRPDIDSAELADAVVAVLRENVRERAFTEFLRQYVHYVSE
jgi:death-on-curing protein